ncbi:MAG: D-sedoheptulose 7-phosphate isomerase [Chloroflexota bacterium]|jgi:D-sedoheptulose 7-phosphate isomerase|nr:D-sedoheptulose 7-phosphate isomerase [Chloroflexota bacterium]
MSDERARLHTGVETVLRAALEDHRAVAAEVESLLPVAAEVAARLCEAFAAGGRLYSFGNGGSAADAQHLAAEMIGRYRRARRPLPAVSLVTDPSVVSCIANDFSYDEVFARQVEALAEPRDVVVGFTTSGRSPSVVAGLRAARSVGATTVLFGAGDGADAAAEADIALLVPSTATARIQEVHLLFLHLVSEVVDAWAAGDDESVVGRT